MTRGCLTSGVLGTEVVGLWWAAVDSNHLPPRYQHGALPVELPAQNSKPTPDQGSLVGGPILRRGREGRT